MPRLTKVEKHLTIEEIEAKIKETKGFWKVQNWLIIYNAIIDPRPLEDIAKHTGKSLESVRKIISQYNRMGPVAIDKQSKGGRRRSYMSLEEESDFLNKYLKKAQSRHLVSIQEIKRDYEDTIGKKVHKTTIYRLLERHEWNKKTFKPK